MILAFQSDLVARIRQAVVDAYGVTLAEILVQTTPKLELGDMALPLAFELAKKLGRKPREIAQELAPRLTGVAGIARADVAGGGFINLFLDRPECRERPNRGAAPKARQGKGRRQRNHVERSVIAQGHHGARPNFFIACINRSRGSAVTRKPFAPVIVSAASIALRIAASVACTVA